MLVPSYSSLTLQMFIACRGIPVLVGFLEPDYAKYRFVCICVFVDAVTVDMHFNAR